MHGGIGMTLEYAAAHYVKRLLVLETLFGDATHHLAALAARGGLDPMAPLAAEDEDTR